MCSSTSAWADYRIGEEGAWSDPAQLDRQMVLNDQAGVQGQVHFSAKQIRADRLGAVTRYRDKHYASPALLPRMARLPNQPPAAARLVSADRFDKGLRFQAEAPGATSWALYRVVGDAATLVATGRGGTEVTDPAPPAGPGTYCLSGLDRSGNEGPISAPLTVS